MEPNSNKTTSNETDIDNDEIDEKINDKLETKEFNKTWDVADSMTESENLTKSSKKENYISREYSQKMLESILSNNSNHGLTGLQNLGNTCFMNSALQCLSHSIDLTYFMLSKTYQNEINTANSLGQGGRIAKNYYKLLDNLWNGNSRSYAPSELKSAISKIAQQFAGYGQQDSHELLSFLLDGLHEDLNKISKKPYMDIKEKDINESDEDAAKRFWDFHKLRNDSIIVDLFNGQYRSTITCPDCHRVSITYDPYLSVSLNIPKRVKREIYVIPRINIKRTVRLSIYVAEDSLFYDIGAYINKHLDEQIGKFRCMVVLNNVVERLNGVNEKISHIKIGSFVFCCEVDPKMLKHDYYTMTIHVYDIEEKDYFCYPRMMTISETQTIADLKANIYGFMRRYITLPEEISKVVGTAYNDLVNEYTTNKTLNSDNYDEVIKNEYEMIFSENSTLDKDVRKKFLSSLPFNSYIDIDNKTKKYIFNFNDNEMTDCFKDDEKLVSLIGAIKSGYKFNIGIINVKSEVFNESLKQLKTCITTKEKPKELTLSDCLDHFKMTEKLDKSNEWYCNVCKKHKQAYKKLDLFYTPKLLIFTLKRFEYTTVGTRYFRTYAEKINTSVEFPTDDLDLSPWIVGPHSPTPKYDLYAVSQHYGSTGGGHYTAVAKNLGKWHNFNDSSVSNCHDKNISDNASYLLFYRRRD